MPAPTDGSTAKVIDVKTFWRALGFLGLSASHISADPPLMLASIDKRTSALQTVLAARHFAVNFLPAEAKEIADLFGGKGTLKGADRFQVGNWQTLTTGAPVLSNALGAMDCALEQTIDHGGISIVIGRVVDVLVGDGNPLIHFRGGYLA
jgi:flavin reductase (DIM6/NTAB) family NADH-FMN oxidoreductase RutF